MLEKWKSNSKKKVVGMAVAGMVAFGTFGGTAYAAYGDSWNTYIKNGVNQVYTLVFPEIEKATEDKQKDIIGQIKGDIRANVESVKSEIEKHKDKLIKDNQHELDKYYAEVKKEAETTKNDSVKTGKSSLDEKAEDSLKKAKSEIDKAIEAELKKIGTK